MDKKKVLVLLSGGMDSGVSAAYYLNKGYEVKALIVKYGQSHPKEITKAVEIANYYDIPYRMIDLTQVFIDTNSYLTGKAEANTYVPARNLVFSSIAIAIAEDEGFDGIVIGAHKEDAGGYPDTTIEFIEKLDRASQEGTKNNIKVYAPFVTVTKDVIVKVGMELEFPFDKTITCYNNEEPACGKCNSCTLRREAFEKAGFIDPVVKNE